jgi:hypothetical protein
MKTIHNYIVKIITPGSLGSGLIYFPSDAPEEAYVFTARHLLTKANGELKANTDIQIIFFDTLNSVCNVTNGDVILSGSNNDSEDFAVIAIKKTSIPGSIEFSNTPGLAILTGKEKNCFVTGIPKVVQNKVPRTLYLGKILDDKDYAEQVQVEISDPISDQYNADNLVEGYSGSPLLITSGKQHFVFGFFSQYEQQTKRILAVNFSKIQQLLKDAGYPELPIVEVETDDNTLADIQKLSLNTSRVLNRIRDEVGTIKLGRIALRNDLNARIRKYPFLLISGIAGIGKSALIKNILSDLSTEFEVIVFQGEQLDKPTISEVFQEGPFKLSNDLESVLDSRGMKPDKILLIDSIEKILETSNAGTIIDFFGLLNKRSDLKIILTCRTYAVEQLKIVFLQQFREFNLFEIPLLSDAELDEIRINYPGIGSLLKKASLERLLKIPFNLDKAVLVEKEILETGVNSEIDFKRIMWEYVIENRQKDVDTARRKLRGEVFSEIALRRAKDMTPYTNANNLDINILTELGNDNIVEKNAIGNQFAASHDIYEDWALTRYIENSYLEFLPSGNTVESFFIRIGFAPAVRRAFRIWISEKLQNADYNTNELLQNVLRHQTLQHYWKDEIIIAVMQSPYSATFLNDNKDLLLSDDFRLFKRTVLLLKVACQQPDLSNIQAYKKNEDKPQLYQSYNLKPVGRGWENLVNFIYDNLKDLTSHYSLIINFLLQWEKSIGIWDIGLPAEARNAGLIIVEYFKYSPAPDVEDYVPRKKNVTDCIHLLFKLASVIPHELQMLLESALKFNRKDRTADKDVISEKVIKEVLSGFYGVEVCRLFPELILKIAEKEWFYYKPTAEELAKMLEGSPFKSIPREMDKEEEFGVKHGELHIFPASPYQVPIINLLYSSTEKTLEFIVKLFNHSLDTFLQSDFLAEDSIVFNADLRKEVQFTLPDGTVVTQKGTLALWLMFRGTFIATPYLLQSVLMALEKWMLQMAEFANKKKTAEKFLHFKEQLMLTYDYLLKNSRSVATTSVLVSVATAYPDLLAEKMLPIFTVKEFYKWDLERCHHEHSALAPLGSSSFGEFIQKERYESNHLPHRKEHLEMLFLKLSLGNYGEVLIKILDNFYSENPQESHWKFSLNRMDKRKLKIVKEEGDVFLVTTKIDDDLLPQAEAVQKQVEEIAPLNLGLLWAHNKLENKTVHNDTFSQWQVHYNSILSSTISGDQARLYLQPTVIAAVGIRDYYCELSPDELKWCTSKIFQVVDYEIKRSFNQYDIGLDSPYGGFESGPAFVALTDLVYKSSGDEKARAKELLFVSLIFVHDKLDRDKLISKFKTALWVNAPEFAFACITGLVEYSEITDLKRRIIHSSHWLQEDLSEGKENFFKRAITSIVKFFREIRSTGKPGSRRNRLAQRQKWINEYENTLADIISKVVQDNHSIDLAKSDFNELPAYLLFEAASLIPASTAIPALQQFISFMIAYIKHNLNEKSYSNDAKIHYELLQKFEKNIASFMLNQPGDISLEKFKELFSLIARENGADYYPHKEKDFLKRCLDELISQVINDHSLSQNFWRLWQYFSQEFQNNEVPFADKLFLDYSYWNTDEKNWPPLKNKKSFYEPIIPHLAEFKSFVKLLSGVGFKELMPEGLLWLSQSLDKIDFEEKNLTFFTEQLSMDIFYDREIRAVIRNNNALREAFINILDKLIDQSSSPAFLIRESFISLN